MVARRGALILAAGASQRMGTPKALLPWAGTTLLDYVLEEARAAGVEEIVVVLGPATPHLELSGVRVAFNSEPATGRSTSIRIGSGELSDDIAAVLVQSVDQPVPSEVTSALFEALRGQVEIALPIYAGRRGHPICLTGRLLPELRTVNEEDQGLRSVVRRHVEHLVEVAVNSESVVWNLNDPAAYAAARSTLADR